MEPLRLPTLLKTRSLALFHRRQAALLAMLGDAMNIKHRSQRART
jgi:hypothetical protein